MPKWLGTRKDLITLGGEKSNSNAYWRDVDFEPSQTIIKKIVGCVMELAVLTVMSTHIYSFEGELFLQVIGGPIGLRSTAAIANLIMKIWDSTYLKLLNKEQIEVLLYVRYVDDNRSFTRPIREGYRWVDNGLKFSYKWQREDIQSGKDDQQRTCEILVKAMNSISRYLQFTPEPESLLEHEKLPTLDTKIWWCTKMERIMFEYYEKPSVPNRTLQKDTALSQSTVRASLTQDLIRRMLNCSEFISAEERVKVIDDYTKKLINGGHSQASTKIILVHALTKYYRMFWCSRLNKDDKKYRPLYLDKNDMQYERKIKKVMARGSWFQSISDDEEVKLRWRDDLTSNWKGARPLQTRVKGFEYISTLTVPSTEGSELLIRLARAEPGLTRLTGFAIKLVEAGGTPLFLSFKNDKSKSKCPRIDCIVCAEHNATGASRCMVKSVVYLGECLDCKKTMDTECNFEGDDLEKQYKYDIIDDLFPVTFDLFADELSACMPLYPDAPQIYVGETSRTLYERSHEHVSGALRLDKSNFIVKHWLNYHFKSDVPPRFKFSVHKQRPDALGRLAHESVTIQMVSNLNSRGEWGGDRITRIRVDIPKWKQKKIDEEELKLTAQEEEKLNQLTLRVNQKKINCCCDSCNSIMTADAPHKKGKRKNPCDEVVLSNTIYFNCYRSSFKSTATMPEREKKIDGRKKRKTLSGIGTSIKSYFTPTRDPNREETKDSSDHEKEKDEIVKQRKPLNRSWLKGKTREKEAVNVLEVKEKESKPEKKKESTETETIEGGKMSNEPKKEDVKLFKKNNNKMKDGELVIMSERGENVSEGARVILSTPSERGNKTLTEFGGGLLQRCGMKYRTSTPRMNLRFSSESSYDDSGTESSLGGEAEDESDTMCDRKFVKCFKNLSLKVYVPQDVSEGKEDYKQTRGRWWIVGPWVFDGFYTVEFSGIKKFLDYVNLKMELNNAFGREINYE